MSEGLRIHLEGTREQIRRLRAWREQWAEGIRRIQQLSRELGGTVRAAPGQQFEGRAAALHGRLLRVGERVELLARTLEQALERLERAFHEAAAELREERLAEDGSVNPLPTQERSLAPDHSGESPSRWDGKLAVDQSGKSLLYDQFQIRFPIPNAEGQLPQWNTACGPVALSMVLSQLKREQIPAQQVVNKLVLEVWDKKPEDDEDKKNLEKLKERLKSQKLKEISFYTDPQDLIEVADQFGVKGEVFYFQARAGWANLEDQERAEKAWEDLNGLLHQPGVEPGSVIALVTAKRDSAGGPSWWKAKGLIPEEVIPEASQRAKGPGGVLTGSHFDGGDGVAHWVVVDRLEKDGSQRYVVIRNPFKNREERYTWEYFWRSIHHQAIEADGWWVLRFQRQSHPSPQKTSLNVPE